VNNERHSPAKTSNPESPIVPLRSVAGHSVVGHRARKTGHGVSGDLVVIHKSSIGAFQARRVGTAYAGGVNLV
jgi:hypothetical protein